MYMSEQSMFPRIEEMRGVDAFLCLPLLLLLLCTALSEHDFECQCAKKALKGLLHFYFCVRTSVVY